MVGGNDCGIESEFRVTFEALNAQNHIEFDVGNAGGFERHSNDLIWIGVGIDIKTNKADGNNIEWRKGCIMAVINASYINCRTME